MAKVRLRYSKIDVKTPRKNQREFNILPSKMLLKDYIDLISNHKIIIFAQLEFIKEGSEIILWQRENQGKTVTLPHFVK